MARLIKTKNNSMALSKGEIETKIEGEFCPVHRERPVVLIVNENDINIYGCCSEFENNCRKEIQRILQEQSQKKQINDWKKGFRNDLLG